MGLFTPIWMKNPDKTKKLTDRDKIKTAIQKGSGEVRISAIRMTDDTEFLTEIFTAALLRRTDKAKTYDAQDAVAAFRRLFELGGFQAIESLGNQRIELPWKGKWDSRTTVGRERFTISDTVMNEIIGTWTPQMRLDLFCSGTWSGWNEQFINSFSDPIILYRIAVAKEQGKIFDEQSSLLAAKKLRDGATLVKVYENTYWAKTRDYAVSQISDLTVLEQLYDRYKGEPRRDDVGTTVHRWPVFRRLMELDCQPFMEKLVLDKNGVLEERAEAIEKIREKSVLARLTEALSVNAEEFVNKGKSLYARAKERLDIMTQSEICSGNHNWVKTDWITELDGDTHYKWNIYQCTRCGMKRRELEETRRD